MSDLDGLHANLDAIKRKLNMMPTTRECWAFVSGFAMCGAFVIAITWGSIWLRQAA